MYNCLTPIDFEQYDRGQLAGSKAAATRDHLDSCDRCRAAYTRYRQERQGDSETASPRADRALADVLATATAGAPADKVPRHVPRIEGYRILGVIGQGGMGIVYRAVQTTLNRAVALKVLPAMVGAANPAAVARFRREAAAAARLHHTHIIPIYDFGESRDAYYYAMELISGEPLNMLVHRLGEQNVSTASPARTAELIQAMPSADTATRLDSSETPSTEAPSFGTGSSSTGRGRAYYQQVARWIADAADALHYAHGQGIVHRDIKPSNLILSTDGRIMIADFGLAKSADDDSVTITGMLLGTVRYLSPEQAMAKRIPVDHRTDIYSLGATMYELLCFQPAFPGTDEKQVLAAIITRDPTPPRKVVAAIPPELATICLKTLERSPDARYSTARGFAEDLRRYVNDLPIVAKSPGPLRRAAKFAKRHKAAVSVAAIALILLATGVMLARERQRRIVEKEARISAQLRGNVNLGIALMREHRWFLAAGRFEDVLARDPRNVRALANLAIAKKELYNAQTNPNPTLLEEADALCDRALAAAPKTHLEIPRIWNVKGVLLKKLGRYGEAEDAYREAIALEPEDLYAWDNLGIVQALAGKFEAAEASLSQAGKLGGVASPCNGIAWRNLGSLQLFRGETGAAQSLEQSIMCEPSDPWAYALRARLRLGWGLPFDEIDDAPFVDPFKSLLDAETADRLSGGVNPTIRCILALAYMRNGRFEEAIDHANKALSLEDELAATDYLILAIAEARIGETDSAHQHFRIAHERWPETFKTKGSFIAMAPKGVLWLERADQLHSLANEAAGLLDLEEEVGGNN